MKIRLVSSVRRVNVLCELRRTEWISQLGHVSRFQHICNMDSLCRCSFVCVSCLCFPNVGLECLETKQSDAMIVSGECATPTENAKLVLRQNDCSLEQRLQ